MNDKIYGYIDLEPTDAQCESLTALYSIYGNFFDQHLNVSMVCDLWIL